MPVLSKEFLDIQANMECRFTLKCVRDMTRTYSQIHRTDKYSQHSSIIWPVWPKGRVFVYELSGCGFESSCSHLIPFFKTKNNQKTFPIQKTFSSACQQLKLLQKSKKLFHNKLNRFKGTKWNKFKKTNCMSKNVSCHKIK